ncbi:Uncharacterised protein [Candidatus Gugararchaeum adminiculabundum]|nr:Uncharacterised protein [Candidatus Gugararchaeum adminiculabundum]
MAKQKKFLYQTVAREFSAPALDDSLVLPIAVGLILLVVLVLVL